MKVRLLFGLLLALASSFALAQWRQLPGLGTDIGVGPRGQVWLVGIERVDGGSPVYRWNGRDWSRVEGGAVRVAVDPQGRPWVVNAAGEVLRFERGSWQRLPGLLSDIGIGANGAVWAVGVERVEGGHPIYRWNGRDWDLVPGGAVRIDVDPRGNPWIVNDRGDVLRRVGGRDWERLPGSGTDVTVDSRGTAWLLGADRVDGGFSIQRWTGRDWQRMPGGAVAISAGQDVWLVNEQGGIFRQEGRSTGGGY